MADEKDPNKPDEELNEEAGGMASDSGLGNLPPLSDFDSQDGLSSDSGLPPMGNFDSGGSGGDVGSLPPISDIQVETPQPGGGNIGQPPAQKGGGEGGQAGKSQPAQEPPQETGGGLDTFSSGLSDLETPTSAQPTGGEKASSGGFQDLAADSDFSPETPEIGPGPDSNVDTPMFDSAFGGGEGGFGGGGDSGGFDQAVETPAPTQAMETPMFGGSGPHAPASVEGQGFDQGAFGADSGFDVGTPPPDLTPTSGGMAQPATGGAAPPPPAAKGGMSPLIVAAAAVIALIAGIVAGPYASQYLPLPNPSSAEIDRLQGESQTKDQRIAQLQRVQSEEGGAVTISPEERDKLLSEMAELRENISTAQADYDKVSSELTDARDELTIIEEDIATQTEEFVSQMEKLESLQNETAIIQARQRGLVAEVQRLTGQVGQLDDANQRRVASKNALEVAVDRLYIEIKEGMPLTPEKFSYERRLENVSRLRDRVAESKWLTPALQEQYTNLYLAELEIASASEYFFANVPVTDKFGNKTRKWAECLMNGNWRVLYRTLDGKNIGTYENLGDKVDPRWGFREDFTEKTQKTLEEQIVASRVDDYLEKVEVLALRELAEAESSEFQQAFSSL